VPGYDAAARIGAGAPNNTPPEIIDKLNNEINAAPTDPKLKLRLADLGSSVAGGSAARDYGRRLEEAKNGATLSARPTSRRNEASLHGHFERDVMELLRRNFLHLAAGAAALPAVSRIAQAQTVTGAIFHKARSANRQVLMSATRNLICTLF
jgi:Tripartite tricarboxylate transporter family receptor